MLRLSKRVLTGVAAAGLLASTPALAQGAGLGSRLDAQEQQLAQAEKTCGPVNLAEYARLLQEASQNKQRAEKAKKKGVPVDETQVNADLAKAMSLFARAQAAQARNCMLQAQQQAGQPQLEHAQNLNPWARDVLAAHNAEREAVGSPALKWRDDLAEHAQARAAELAQAQQLIHAPREARGTERENILQAPRGYTAAQEMGRWTREASNFVPGKFPYVSKTGNWPDVAHYTQMVSIQTTFIGCGHAMGGGFDWVVCRYDPGGNKDGKPILSESGSQPQLVMREKEAPLPKTDAGRVHQTPMAQPQGDSSVARMAAYDARIPWNQQQPMQPVSQPMTPPPESILDDVATNNFIRPRLIGGDYGSDADLEAIYNVNLTGGLADLFPDLDLFADALVRDFADRNAPTGSYPHIFDDTIIVDLPAAVGNQPIGTYPQIYADAVTLNGGTLVATIAMPDGLYETKFYDNIVDGIAPDVFVTPAPFTVVLLGEQPITPTIDLVGDLDGPSVRRCPVDFGSGDLSRRLDQAEVDLNKKIAAGESIDLREYEKLAAEAEQAKQAAYEADRAAGGGIDARPYLQNSDKAGHLLKTAEAAAGTKLETPDLGGTPALIDPNARSPIDLKLSDCVQ